MTELEMLQAELAKGNASTYDPRYLKREIRRLSQPTSFTIECQWTGIAFEATSKRFKTHPGMAITNDWPSIYRQRYANAARTAGTFDALEVEQTRREIIAELIAQDDARLQRENDRRQAEKDRQYARNERAYTNSILRDGGYRWSKTVEDEESMDFAGPNAFGAIYGNRDYAVIWTLFAPDGRAVSIREAMTELAAEQNGRAARWLSEHREP